MKRIFWSVFLSSILALSVFLMWQGLNIKQNHTKASSINKDAELEALQKSFAPAKQLLLENGVPFDPDLLARKDWQQKISLSAAFMPEFNTTLRLSNRLKGVQIAGTLILPQDVELTGDTVLLANTIIYEGKQTRIHGLGTSVYVYPIVSTGHIAVSFEEEMRIQGVTEHLPEINEPTTRKFTFNVLKETTSLEIDVSGQGYKDWLAKKKEHEEHPEMIVETICLPNIEDCSVYGPAYEGTEGTGGQHGLFPNPPTQIRGPDGYCFRVGTNNGQGGPDFDGDDGDDGKAPSVADAGKGGTGGSGGNIVYTITNLNEVHTLLSLGGQADGEALAEKAVPGA